jgi:hypothetical protein
MCEWGWRRQQLLVDVARGGSLALLQRAGGEFGEGVQRDEVQKGHLGAAEERWRVELPPKALG